MSQPEQSTTPRSRPRRQRGRGLRTTTGCATCKKRRVKCDELKPVCGPCTKSRRACEYAASRADGASSQATNSPLPKQQHEGSREERVPAIGGVATTIHGDLAQHANDYRADIVPARPTEGDSVPSDGFTPGSALQQWSTPAEDNSRHNFSPQSSVYGLDVAPLRWFGLLAGDAAHQVADASSLETLSDAALSQEPWHYPRPSSASAIPGVQGFYAPETHRQLSETTDSLQNVGSIADERACWQAQEPLALTDREQVVFARFVKDVSRWIDVLDPLAHFSSLVPRLALYNLGLMKAILALGARQNSIRPPDSGEIGEDRTVAVQYYYETLQYLQKAMRFASYKNSPELLATVLIVSKFEMIDGAGEGWERHLKGVFWIQRSRDINGESGGLEQAIWWAWIRQDVWAAFREGRRCFSFFKPTRPYHAMSIWDKAAHATYLLAQAVNYSSEEEKQAGEKDLGSRIARADVLLTSLEGWRSNTTIHFDPLPTRPVIVRAFEPIWIVPEAFGVSLQLYNLARILVLLHKPSAAGFQELAGREKTIEDSIATIAGIAMELTENATRFMSTQCLFGAGLYCKDEAKRECIVDLIQEHRRYTGWPCNIDLGEELRSVWRRQDPE